MPSLDFVYDLVEKLDEEKLEYLIVTMREGREENKVDAFFSIKPESEDTFYTSLEEIKKVLKEREGINVTKKPKRKRKRKKGE
tara:strand:+ start:1476 stop:1724 length:249 start_codon:yes stop_codon:yes gene_type:complete